MLPISLRYTFGNERVKGYVSGGLTLAYHFWNNLASRGDTETTAVFPLQGVYFGGNFGGGLLVKAGKGYLNFDLRYTKMYGNLWESDSFMKPNYLSPTIGYQFSLGKK